MLPSPLLGLDCNNGREFINHNLYRYSQREHITLTGSRPYRKNDTSYVEQTDWRVVRRLVGYRRFEAAALPSLHGVYAWPATTSTSVNQCADSSRSVGSGPG